MSRLIRVVPAFGIGAFLALTASGAAGQQQVQKREQVQQRVQEKARQREIIPGSELMTPEEREAYRRRYAAAKTDEERARVRAEHVAAMQERARIRGLRLAEPEEAKGRTR
jgi:hypothetical protein